MSKHDAWHKNVNNVATDLQRTEKISNYMDYTKNMEDISRWMEYNTV
jgi:hypothetical protein